LVDLFIKDLGEILTTTLHQVLGSADDTALVMSFSSGIYQNQPLLPWVWRKTSVARR